jgi:hypothetical protein
MITNSLRTLTAIKAGWSLLGEDDADDEPKNSSWPTTKSTKNARKGTWERDGLHPPGKRARLPNRVVLFVFFVFSVVKLLRLG